MTKSFYSCLCCLLFLSVTMAQDFTPRNPTNTRHVIDAREVADPTAKDKTPADKNNDNDQAFRDLTSKLPSMQGFGLKIVSNYFITSFLPKTTSPVSVFFREISNIKLIDARFDNAKVGFCPAGYELQKKGYEVLGLQISKNPVEWLQTNLLQKIIQDTGSNRQLVMVLTKLWFTNSANEPYSASAPKLLTTLHYQFDIYTAHDFGYYPQRKISGTFTEPYKDGNAYNALPDSLLVVLQKELPEHNYAAKETEANWLSPVDFNNYYNGRIRNAAHFEKMPKGVYASFADFLEKKVTADSVEMIVKYNNYERTQTYACQLIASKDGRSLSCNRLWGYFDGSSIFLNTGNGFFVRLTRSKDDYVFFQLKSIKEEKIKPDILEGIYIGDSQYKVLKGYTKAFALTYQLNPETGKLY